MNQADLFVLLPILIIAATPVAVMVAVAFRRNHSVSLGLTLAGLTFAFLSLVPVAVRTPHGVTALLILDRFSLVYAGLLFAATAAVAGLMYGYLETGEGNADEFYILLVLGTLGSVFLAASRHFASFFLGLETLSVALYGMIAYLRRRAISIEAGMKYLILAGVASAFLVFGMALVYGGTGTMEFARLAALLQAPLPHEEKTLMILGFGMILIGIGFKLAVVPFHMWTPDVYEGAPAPVTAYVATVSKGAVVAILLRLFYGMEIQGTPALFWSFAAISIASMVVGNFLALLQDNVKRILAYSSIAHLGYVLVAFLASGDWAVAAVTFYMVTYVVTTLGAFGVVAVLSGTEGDADRLSDYRGLAWRHPWLTATFTAMVLSLAGLPLTAGFVGKFIVVVAGLQSALWFLVMVLLLTSGIGLYYYLRILVAMFSRPPQETPPLVAAPAIPFISRVVLAVLALLLLWLGLGPGPLLQMLQTIAAPLS